MRLLTARKKNRVLVGVVVASRRRVVVDLKPLRPSSAVRTADCNCARAFSLHRKQGVRPVAEELTCRLKILCLQAWPQSLAAVEALTSGKELLGQTVAVGCCSGVLFV
jgi:hypothetical protein